MRLPSPVRVSCREHEIFRHLCFKYPLLSRRGADNERVDPRSSWQTEVQMRRFCEQRRTMQMHSVLAVCDVIFVFTSWKPNSWVWTSEAPFKSRVACCVQRADMRRNTGEPSEVFRMPDWSPSGPKPRCRGESSQDMPVCTWQQGREEPNLQIVLYLIGFIHLYAARTRVQFPVFIQFEQVLKMSNLQTPRSDDRQLTSLSCTNNSHIVP